MLCTYIMSPGKEVHDANNKGHQHPERREEGPRWVALLPQEDACTQIRQNIEKAQKHIEKCELQNLEHPKRTKKTITF